MNDNLTDQKLLLPFLLFVFPLFSDAQQASPRFCDTIVAKSVEMPGDDLEENPKGEYQILIESGGYKNMALFNNGKLLLQDTIAHQINHGCYQSCCKSDTSFVFDSFNGSLASLELVISRHDKCLFTTFELQEKTKLILITTSYEILEESEKEKPNPRLLNEDDEIPMFEDQTLQLDYSKPEIMVFQYWR